MLKLRKSGKYVRTYLPLFCHNEFTQLIIRYHKVMHDINLLPCFLRKSYPAIANDYIQVLTSVVPGNKIFEDSDWLNTLEAMNKFIDFTTLKSTGSKEGKPGAGFYPKFVDYCNKCKKYSTCNYIIRSDNDI